MKETLLEASDRYMNRIMKDTSTEEIFQHIDFFSMSEFECPCCGKNEINPKLIVPLDMARRLADVAFSVSSGFRCEAHNKKVGGSPTSSHLHGLAVDIRCKNSVRRFTILKALFQAGFSRIEIADKHIHIDIDPAKTKDVCWIGVSQ